MAERLFNLGNLLGGSSNTQSGGLMGGGIFSQPESRGQRRSRLLTDAIASAGQNPYARLGASFGGLIGLGGRAAAEGLGIVDAPAEVQRNEAIRQVQQEVSQLGLDPLSNPTEFGQVVSSRFRDLGYDDLAVQSLAQAGAIRDQFAPEPVETTIRAVGGTDRAKALAERYPDVGQIEEGQEFSITLSDGEFRSVNAGAAPQEEKVAASIREYEQALERGLIDPSTSYPDFLNLGSERSVSSGTGTEADRNLFLTTIDEDEDLKTSVESLMTGDEEAGFLGFGGGAPADEESTRLAVAAEAKNISDDAAASGQRISPKQAIRQAVQNLRTTESQTAPQENNEDQQRDQGPASPQNDAYADRLNP